MAIYKSRLNVKEVISLFGVIVFPIHAWSIFLVLKDFEWVYDQQGTGILIGYAAYSLLFAFVESFIFLVFLFLLSHLLPKQWSGRKSLTILSQGALAITFWAIANQVFFLLLESPPEFLSWILLRVPFRQTLGFTILIILILTSIILPLILVERSKKYENGVIAIIQRISLLSSLYLVLDFISLIIIIFRNIPS